MSSARSGTALLLCLALAVFAAMIGFAFLRSATRHAIAGRSERITALAREAALSGLTHATEQILADYNGVSLAVGSGAGAATVALPPTFLDGPYRAPFVSLHAANVLSNYASYPDADDVRHEHPLTLPQMGPQHGEFHWWHTAQGGYLNVSHFESGCQIYDGRGRYHEANHYALNASRSLPTEPAPTPATTVRFTDAAAPEPDEGAGKGIRNGLYLDDAFRRLPAGSATAQRAAARYRLRYAVGVEDLQGHLLINPRAQMNVDWTDPGNDYRGSPLLPAWIEQSAYAMDNMVSEWCGYAHSGRYDNWRMLPLAMGHIMRGRGSTSNVDRKAADPRRGLPTTFPMMFRGRLAGSYPAYSAWHGYFVSRSLAGYTPPPALGGQLYDWNNSGNTNYEPVAANPAGGEVLTPPGHGNTAYHETLPYTHSLLGPVAGWYQMCAALQGVRLPHHDGNDYWEWDQGGGNYLQNESRAFGMGHILNTTYTPFGRSLERSAAAPADWTWYQGRVDSPFHVNLLTAAPQTISQMLFAYLPPELKTLLYSKEEKYYRIRIDTRIGSDGKPYSEDVFDTVPYQVNTISKTVKLPGIDILTELAGSGFSEFPAPYRDANGNGAWDAGELKPDYYQTPPDWQATTAYGLGRIVKNGGTLYRCIVAGTSGGAGPSGTAADITDGTVHWARYAASYDPRPPAQRYPGPLGRGDPGVPDQGPDDLGRHIDVSSGYDGKGQPFGWCTATFNPLLFYGGADKWITEDIGGAPPKNRHRVATRIDPKDYLYADSYLWDLTYAMTTAIAYARATWVQYPTTVFDPRPSSADFGFAPASLRDPLACSTIEQIDALFLRQLGEDYAHPGTGSRPANPIVGNIIRGTLQRFTVSPAPVSRTIRELVQGKLISTAWADAHGATEIDRVVAERGKVMERMLNDYRMSFLGSSPRYADFRPLDFDGDGRVQCSCYDRRGLSDSPPATADEQLFRTDRWKPAEPGGRGPAPAPYAKPVPAYTGTSPWFTVSGNFFIGKSRYFRVFVRGELYDNLLRTPIAQQNLESVLVVDPEGPGVPVAGRPSAEQRVLFQRWHHSPVVSELPFQAR